MRVTAGPVEAMARERQAEVPLGRRYIIKRPRLTRLLDASTARIIMLVAPAGYGKTTLAREWLENRPHAWYRGGPATADVAALSVGLGDAASAFLPRAPVRVRERLRATASPEQDVKPLAEILAEDLAEWPEDAWLAIDDYQFAMEAAAAEAFVDLLVELAPIRLLLTSRARPTWATSRRLLYGEIHELGRNLLAMNQEEATEVLAAKESEAPGLVALAEGWPAVIGLAALTRGNALPPEDVPARLYDFFAEELYAAAPPALREGLAALAIAPSIDQRVAAFLFGAESDELLEEGVRLGVLSQSDDGGVEIHPLLREFLESKLQEQDPPAVRELALNPRRHLIEERR